MQAEIEQLAADRDVARAEAERWKSEHDAHERCINSLDETIGSLESENRDLKGEVAELVKEVQSLREQGRDIETELDTATKDRDGLCACMIGNKLVYHQVGSRREPVQVWVAVDREFRSYPEAKAFLLKTIRTMTLG